jgi:N4-(beta-N-acetylglucosaminyl)-L-asparaginase
MSGTTRRDLLKGAAILPLAAQAAKVGTASGTRPAVVSSANGLPAVEKAYAILAGGGDPVDAVVSGVNILEDDPEDVTVGYGGIPNEEGVVQLDASVMDGRVMKCGGVGALEGIRYPSRVARLVMQQTNRSFLVGAGAKKFALAHGFKEENLLTERSRKIWLYWKEQLSKGDDWMPRGDEEQTDPDIRWYIDKWGTSDFRAQGTVNVGAVTANGDLAGCTSTSGLFFKIPGRLGDSPVIGAGLYVDGEIGACGSTGWGEGNLRSCGSHTVIELMRQGKSPEQAALGALERIVNMSKERRNAKGRPNFDLNFYVVSKSGVTAGAAVYDIPYENAPTNTTPSRHAVADTSGARLVNSAYLFKKAGST